MPLNAPFPYGMQRFNGQPSPPSNFSAHSWRQWRGAKATDSSPQVNSAAESHCYLKATCQRDKHPSRDISEDGGTTAHSLTPRYSGSPWPHTDVILDLLHHGPSLCQSQPDYVGYNFCLRFQALNFQQFGSL